MTTLDIGLRASVVMLAALAASAALRHRSAALRHWVLAAGIFSAAVVAPLGRALPAWDLPVLPPSMADEPLGNPSTANLRSRDLTIPTSGSAIAAAPSPRPPLERSARLAWLAGFILSIAVMLASLYRLRCVTLGAVPIADRRWRHLAHELSASLSVRDRVPLMKTRLPGMVGTWGWRRPAVLLPAHCETWSDDRIRIVLGHELAHIRRADWAIQIAAELVRAVFWYNPLFWIACARLRHESEQACDDAVLEVGVPAADYASHLLEIARTCRPVAQFASLVPMARRSTLEWRIAAMLNNTLARRRPTRLALAFALAVVVGVVVPTASFRATEQAGPLPLTGMAYDMTGGVLPDVALVLKDEAGNEKTGTTDSAGRFDLGVVAPGRYELSSKLMGFSGMTQSLNLAEARQWEHILTLQLGTLQETITVTEQRPSGTPSRAGRAPVKIGGNIRPPHKLEDMRPVYPPAMRDAGIEGAVPLGAVIGLDGRVNSLRVIGTPHPDLAKAAIEAVRQWRFSQTLLNGEAVEVFMNVSVWFKLEG